MMLIPVTSLVYQISILEVTLLTLRTSELVYRLCANFPVASHADIPALRKLPGASHAGILALFSKAYWHQNARVIEIQTRQQLKNNLFHETQRMFVNKFCIWTTSGQRTS